jgi:hypothetical protein
MHKFSLLLASKICDLYSAEQEQKHGRCPFAAEVIAAARETLQADKIGRSLSPSTRVDDLIHSEAEGIASAHAYIAEQARELLTVNA